jgi:hypothetical protein
MRFKKYNKCIILLIVFLSFNKILNAQPVSLGKPRIVILSKKQLEADEKNRNCAKRKNYSREQRIKFFPFNIATHIKLISFEGVLEKVLRNSLDTLGKGSNHNKVSSIAKLNKNQVDSLTDILYNIGYRGRFYTIVENQCYIPRNAILFLNAKGATFAFIEICFECSGNRLSSPRIKSGDFCEQKYILLSDFFSKMGVTLPSVRQ